ncbi:hypothetical protein [Ornatilinea apprima]|nr:hypothetical protein [Ornatilinea apprima]
MSTTEPVVVCQTKTVLLESAAAGRGLVETVTGSLAGFTIDCHVF